MIQRHAVHILWIMAIGFAALTAAVIIAPLCRGSETGVLLPVYDAPVGARALAQCPKGKEGRLWLVVNPNSGPGSERDAQMAAVVSLANARRCHVLFYIDALAIPGDGLVPASAQERVKKPAELVDERAAYSKFYGSLKWDGWFVDDFAASMRDVALCVSNWPGTKVLNPGCAMVPARESAGAIVVISEQAKAWPRALTPWEKAHKNQCAVMGLKISADSLPAFLGSTRGMALRYASPLDDQWRNGQSAYSTLTPYFGRLFE